MKPEIIKLIEENPDLPVVPMVNSEVVADDSYTYWMGKWGNARLQSIIWAMKRYISGMTIRRMS